MEEKKVSYALINEKDNVEVFLKSAFNQSSSRLKKYFSKSILNKMTYKKMELELPLNFVNDGMINPSYVGENIKVIEESDHFYVFSKNPNQHIHPLTYDESDNCLSYLRANNRSDLLSVNGQSYDRGLLYRLDYETSGVVVYVKNNEDYSYLRENFATVAHNKIYHCWVHNRVTNAQTLRHSFGTSELKGKKVKVANVGDFEKLGELSFRPLEYNEELNQSLLEVKLKTGLRHQIRAQLSHIGYPIVGDTLYDGKPANRLYLHAYEYVIEFKGQRYVWQSKPIDFNGL